MRSYFLSSLRNISKLNLKEINELDRFVKLFKKKGETASLSYTWSNIDEESIRETFKSTIKNKTPIRDLSGYLDLFTLLAKRYTVKKTKVDYEDISAVTLYDFSYSDCTYYNTNLNLFSEKENLLYSITKSRYWIVKDLYRKMEIPLIGHIKDIVKTARYYIYSFGTDDDYYNSKINHTLMNMMFNFNYLRHEKDDIIKLINKSNLTNEEKEIVICYINHKTCINWNLLICAISKLLEVSPKILEFFSSIFK